jgi:hypothetical protein
MKVAVFHYAPYLPDFVSAAYFLFPTVRFALKGQHIQSIMEIQGAVTRKLTSILEGAFLEGIKNCMNM